MKRTKSWVNKHEYQDFLKNAIAIEGSVTPQVIKNVFIIMIYSTIVSILYLIFPVIALPIGPFEYTGVIMGLILVFRVNAGYDRWWEARKIWGNIVNQSRNLAIIIMNYSTIKDNELIIKLTNSVDALPYLIKNHLRSDASLKQVKPLLEEGLYQKIYIANNRPNILLSEICKELAYLHKNNLMDSFSFLQAEEKRGFLIDNLGACERILKTPMPFVMAVKSRRFILLFLITLPFALVNVSVYINPIVIGIIAYTLLSLDQIGVELQNPFSEKSLSHLPLNEICINIEKDIKEMQEV